VIGGKLKSVGSNAVLGGGEFIVAEADESDGSFLKMAPTIAVVTNIDREHLDYYPDLAAVQSAFLAFIDRIPFYGRAVLCLDDEPIQNLIPEIQKPFVTYGLSTQADLAARHVTFQGLTSRFEVEYRGEHFGNVVLNLPGIHNVYNALAAIAVGLELDLAFDEIAQALETLQGVQRRMEIKGTARDILVMDDYGHHPTEIKATLGAVRESWPDRRHVVVFQPHRFSRTRALFDEFSRAFYQSDLLVMLPVYSAGEDPISGVDAEALCRAISTHGHKETHCVADKEEAQSYLKEILKPGDLLLTLGAGDVWKVGMSMLSYFEQAPDGAPDPEGTG